MKLIIFFFLNFFLLFNSGITATMLTKSEILKKSNTCFKDSQMEVCKKLILQMEKLQLNEFEQNRFKCQSSILGLQTELVGAYFFNKNPKRTNGIMIPHVIKNC